MNGSSKSILVVDDEIDICNFVKMFFERRNFSVYQASNSSEAIKISEECKPTIVLLDINMGGPEDGLDTLPKILSVSSDSKVVMTTAVDDEESVMRAKALGAVDYMTKPLVLEDLERTVLTQAQP